MNYQLGIIEGFYGLPWSFSAREAYIPFMQQQGFSFYLYAPKADIWLREQWQQAFPAQLAMKLRQLGEQFRQANIDWGVGLSPMKLHENFDAKGRQSLKQKLSQIEALGCNYLAILFDDMKGDFPDLAQTQVEICHFIQEQSQFERLLMCPSYYSFDPVLEKVFGKMPENYLQDLGDLLHEDVDIFWTGENVCSTSYSKQHLELVARLLKRKPFIWDNYPVNDGARMSPFLHMSPFQGRENCYADLVSGLAVNPMNEAWLSQLVLSSLKANIEGQDAYQTWKLYIEYCLGSAAQNFVKDLPYFEQQGLLNLEQEKKQNLLACYRQLADSHNQAYLLELCDYLEGKYLFDLKAQEVPTQLLWEE